MRRSLADFSKAKELLPETYNAKDRDSATKGAAMAMLAKALPHQ